MTHATFKNSLDPQSSYHFWLPSETHHIKTGPEQIAVPLPQVPLPLKGVEAEDLENPSDNLIGTSVYEYLRRFPDCQYNREYAELLRDAYPHFISDLASQAIMLGSKDVAAPYLQRLVNYLKILHLLDGDNSGLLQQIGLNYYRLAMNFEVLVECRKLLISARHYLQASRREATSDQVALNYLGQIAYLFGDYPDAIRFWTKVYPVPPDPALDSRLRDLAQSRVPQRPLIEELEQIGEAMVLFGGGEIEQAKLLLEMIEERGDLDREFPLAEFHYLLGMCRLRASEPAAAFESFEKSLQIDPDYEPAIAAKDNLFAEGG